MYQPSHFVQNDRAALAALMRDRPLATLVTSQSGVVTADHVPLLYESAADGGPGVLRGHVARANPLWREAAGSDVLAIFHGAQAYVSPNWYPSKVTTHKAVPTWNYAVVHATGRLRAIDEAPWLLDLVSRLTERHEFGRERPWSVNEAPEAFVEQMLRAIVGIEIELSALVGKFKMSQNRDAADRAGVARGLAGESADAARAMAASIPR